MGAKRQLEIRGAQYSLYVLLTVQQELEQRAKKVLYALAGYAVDNVALELLGTEVDHVLGKGLGKPVAEQNDKLVGGTTG